MQALPNSASANNREGRTAMLRDNCDIFEVQTKVFLKYLLPFEKQSVFAKSSRTTQLLTFVYLQQPMLSRKALCHTLRFPLYSTFGIKTLHIHSC